MASLRLIEELTAAAHGIAITVIGAEPEPAYNRVLLSALLAGEMDTSEVMMKPRSWYAERSVVLHTGGRAVAIDTRRRQVYPAQGAPVSFDRLVLATGASAVRLPLPGNDLPGVLTFRDFHDVA